MPFFAVRSKKILTIHSTSIPSAGTGVSSNGKTSVSNTEDQGSIPCSPAILYDNRHASVHNTAHSAPAFPVRDVKLLESKAAE